MRSFLAATSVFALALAAPASAQMADLVYNPTGNELSGSELIGTSVYTTEEQMNDDGFWADWDGSPDGFESVGEIHDILLSPEGQVGAVLVDIGGFLGIAEKTIAVSMDALRLEGDDVDGSDLMVVFQSDRETLENAPSYEMAERSGLGSDETNITAKPDHAENMATDEVVAAGGEKPESMLETDEGMAEELAEPGDMMETPLDTDADRETAAADAPESVMTGDDPEQRWITADASDVTVDTLEGAVVYDAEDKRIGEVGEVLMNDNGQMIEAAVIDVGGFLGLGEKPVRMPLEALDIRKESADSDVLRVYLTHTKEEMKEMPSYES